MTDQIALGPIGRFGKPMGVASSGIISAFPVVPPEGSVLYGHFAEDFYWNDGEAGVVGDLLAEDAVNWGSFNPETDITPEVGVDGGSPVLAPTALALILAGARVVFVIGDDGGLFSFDLRDIAGTTLYQGRVGYEGQASASRIYDNTSIVNNSPELLPPGTIKAAFHIEDGLLALSINEGAVVSIDPAVAWAPGPELMGLALGGTYLVEMAIYPAAYGGTLDNLSTVTWPVNSVLPAITPNVGTGVLTVSNGTWSNSPTSYSYRWLRNAVAISGEAAATYQWVPENDINSLITCQITAGNARGVGIAATVNFDGVSLRPVNTVLPIITGTPAVGETLAITPGTYTNSGVVAGYQWFQVDPYTNLTAYGNFPSYVLQPSDAGFEVGCYEGASNIWGDGDGGNAVAVGPVT